MTFESLFRSAARCLAISLLFVSPALPAAGVNVWTPVGPWGGTIYDVAVHPTDPRIVYAATDNGLFVTADGGASWRSTSPNLDGVGRAVWDVEVAQSSPSTVYISNGRLYRSTDAGATWERRSPDGFFASQGMAVDPRDPDVVWAGSLGAQRGILRSRDGGRTFQVAYPTQSIAESIAFAAWDPATIFAGLGGLYPEQVAILRSTDGGATWQRGVGITGLSSSAPLQVRVVAAPDAPGTVYAAVATDPGFSGGPLVFRSTDGGATWEASGPGGFPIAAGPHGVVLTGSGAQSLDFGRTWTAAGHPNGQVLALAIDPLAPATAWAGTSYRGLFKTADEGATWRTSHQGIAAARPAGLAIDPVRPGVLYAGLTGGGLWKTGRGGTVWRELDPGLPDPDLFSTYSSLAIDPLAPNRVYAVAEEGRKILGSRDAGLTWQDLHRPAVMTRTTDLTADPGATGVLYAAGFGDAGCRNFKTVDAGATWTCLQLAGALTIDVDPREPSYVYALTDQVNRSVDRGTTWRAARRGVPSSALATSLAVSPSSPNVLYLGTWQGIYKSSDRAQTWRAAGVGLPPGYNRVLALAVDPRSPAIAWAAVEGNGVYRTVDGGAHWRPLNAGLPLQVTGQLVLDPHQPATAYAGSFGGVYKITLR